MARRGGTRLEAVAQPALALDEPTMRRLGCWVVDALVDRIVGFEGGPAWVGGTRAEMEALLREPAPEEGRPVDEVLERAARIMGVAASWIRRVRSDAAYRMDVGALREATAADRAAGLVPLCVCASAGATNTGAVDPLPELAELCAAERVWFHVDAAYGGFAVLTEEGAALLRGIERADSVALDPHKWLFQPYEVGCVLVRDAAKLAGAFRLMPEYLQDVDLGLEHVNFADRGLQLTRSFRALKIWLSVQVFGVGAFRDAIARAMELARRAEAYIRDAERLELLSPASLGVVCYRFKEPGAALGEEALERLNARIQAEIIESGYAMISSTRLRGRYALRLCIVNYRSRWEDVEGVLQRVQEVGARLVRESRFTPRTPPAGRP